MAPKNPETSPENDEPTVPTDPISVSPGESVSIEVPPGSAQHITVNVVGGGGEGNRQSSLLGCVWSVFQGCGCLVLIFVALAFIGSLFR